MASASVYYRFKSQKEPSRITFDGTGISVWDLKREIILQNKMGKGIDFDLAVYNQDTEDEYKDDNFFIPRSSQVIVRRLPPSKPGRGTAANYIADLQAAAAANAMAADVRAAGIPAGAPGAAAGSAGPMDRRGPMYRGQMSMRFDGRDASVSATPGPSSAAPAPVQALSTDQDGDEAARIAAMFQATTEQWDETQERMAHATYRERGGAPRRGGPPRPMTGQHHAAAQHQVSDRPPPIGYTCFRCYKKGHWIHDCPTNDDREFDNKPRLKRTTGIPKSMLKTVEAPTDEMRSQGLMITPDGSYVIAQVDEAEWERNRAQAKVLTRSDVYQSVPSDSSLACPLCSKVIRDAVKTPCCSTTFCEECIQTHLLDNDFTCAECEKRIADLGELQRDDEKRKAVREYIDSEIEKSERKAEDMEREKEEKENGGVAKSEEEGNGVDGGDQDEQDAGKEGTDGEVKKEDGEEDKKPVQPHGLPQKPAEASMGQSSENNEGEDEGNSQGDDKAQQQWNPRAAQQIMMMLMNPQLPPPMRMQLQMQLQIMRAQFLQVTGTNNQGAKKEQGAMSNGNGGGNPFAGQHMGGFGAMGMPPMPMGGMGMGMGMMGMGMNGMNGMGGMGMGGMNPWASFQQANANGNGGQGHFNPRVPPPTNEESAYMRLPVNQNKRVQGQKRERPTDFLELGASDKQPRY